MKDFETALQFIAEDAARIDDLERALREAEKMLSGIFREIDLPGEWENGVSTTIDNARNLLKP